jgi:CoA:oxalate CoA-transferase
MTKKKGNKPLKGIKVLDLTRVLAGPYAAMMLGDMGAEVIKIESPKGDDSRYFGPPYVQNEAIYFMSINRNKKSIVIDLKQEKGVQILKKLVETADVIIENYRPGTMEKLGIGYDVLKKINPKIIYAACSGFGHTGPDSKKPGYDMMIQAQAGIMSITSYKENGPFTRVGVSVADIVAAMNTAFGIAVKLFQREKDNKSDKIDVSMFDSQVALLTPMFANYMTVGKIAKPVGNRHPLVSPFESFKTKDSEIVITAGNQKLFVNLCEVLNLKCLVTDKRFKSNPARVVNNAKLKPIIEKETKKYKLTDLLKMLETAGIPAAPINTVKEVSAEPQVKARNMIQKVSHKKTGDIYMHGIPVKLNSCDDNIMLPPPRLGEHTKEILKKHLNYSIKEINVLIKEKVVYIEKD